MEKNIRKKIMAVFLTLAMAVSLMPAATLTARAATSGYWTDSGNYNVAIAAYTEAQDITVDSPDDLAALAYLVNNTKLTFKGYTVTLAKDIDLSGHFWVPIGTSFTISFQGTFNGAGHTVSGMDATTTNCIYAGLFGSTKDATIKNVTLSGSVTASYSANNGLNAGGLVGLAESTNISSCVSSVNVSAAQSGSLDCIAGGLVGYFMGSGSSYGIKYCSTTGTVTTTHTYSSSGSGSSNCGGLVGYISGGYISSSHCSCTVTASSAYLNVSVGGLTGSSRGTLTNCYSSGSVSCPSAVKDKYAGGLVGNNSSGLIYNSYTTASVSLNGGVNNYAGGLAGNSIGTVSNCYSAGTVTVTAATTYTGGFIGKVASGTVTDCYWLSGAYGSDYSKGYGSNSGTINSLTMLTDSQLKNSGTIGTGTTYYSTGTGSSYSSLAIVDALNAAATSITSSWSWKAVDGTNSGYPILYLSMIYNGNGNEDGTVPVDSTAYTGNDTVNVLGNTGGLTKTGYTFSGWNTKASGTGTSYAAGDTFTITSNVQLYAVWAVKQYTVSGMVTTGTGVSASVNSLTVTLYSSGKATSYSATTGSDGTYSIMGVPAGTYTAVVAASIGNYVESSSSSFTVTDDNATGKGITLTAESSTAPTIMSVSPTSGPTDGGTSITITGTMFTGVTSVSFGSKDSVYTVDSDTQITAVSPAGSAGTVDITVTAAGGASAASSADQFTYVAASVTVPTVTTTNVDSYTETTATVGGIVTSDGGKTVTERGVVYSSTDSTPEIGDTGVMQDANGSGTGEFSGTISGLSPNKTYYVRTYATNSEGTSYGPVKEFTTLNMSTYTVSGTVTYSGLPASGATVTLKNGSGSTAGTGTTGSDGSYTIDNKVKAGSYTAVVSARAGYYDETSSDVTVSSSGTITGANITLTKSSGAPKYFITKDSGGKYLVNGSGSYTTLTSALNTGCTGSSLTIHFGAPDGSLSVAETSTIGNNALKSATYMGSLVITENVTGTSYGLTIQSGVAAVFKGLSITDDISNMTCTGTNVHYYMVYISGGSLDFRSSSIVAGCKNVDAIALLDGMATMSSGTISLSTSSAIGIESSNSSLLTFSGGTISGSGTCICANGAGTLTISGGNLTSSNSYCILDVGTGAINMTGGILTSETSNAVWNRNSSPIMLDGAAVTGKSCGIYNEGTGKLTLKSGTVITTDNRAVFNYGKADVEVCGATISTSGSGLMYGIYNKSTGSVIMSSGAITCSSDTSYGIYNNSTGSVIITGGTVSGKVCLAKCSTADTTYINLYGAKIYGHDKTDLIVSGSLSGGVYSITPANYTASTLKTSNMTNNYAFGKWTGDSGRTAVLTGVNGDIVGNLLNNNSAKTIYVSVVPAYTVSGTVTAGTGVSATVSGCAVTLYSSGLATSYSAMTTSNGAYTIKNVSAGTYTAVIAASSGNYAESSSTSFTVSSAGVTGVDITLLPGGENTAPSFTEDDTALFSVRKNAFAVSIIDLLHVDDTDSGQTLTWTVKETPSHGALTVTGAAASTGSSDITPGGMITYTPAADYSGADSFEIEVNDGTNTDTIEIYVNVGYWDSSATTSFGGGGGTKNDPYKISTAAQLAYLALQVNSGTGYENTYFKLTSDIDLNGAKWMPIGSYSLPFKGIFDGGGHVVSNLATGSVSEGEDNNFTKGLFGSLTRTVENLGVENFTIYNYGASVIGGIAGVISKGGKILNCYAAGNIVSTECYDAGGLAGINSEGYIYNSYSIVNIKNTVNSSTVGYGYLGGISGNDVGGVNINCYAAGNLEGGSDNAVGALVGVGSGSTLTDCYWNSSAVQTKGGTATSVAVGHAEDMVNSDTTAMASGDMKQDTFVAALNESATAHASSDGFYTWKLVSDKNSGYPMLDGVGTAGQSTPSGDSPHHGGKTPSPITDKKEQVPISGEPAAGTVNNTTNSDGQKVTTVTVDTGKLETILDKQGAGATVTIPVESGADVASGVLTGGMVKSMENKDATLEIRTDSATYTVPASEINIDVVSSQLGTNVALPDITVNVSIAGPTDATAKVVADAAADGGFTVEVPAVEFTINCTYNGKTVNVSSFNSYVERMIAIPDGVDTKKITTGIVVKPDGTTYHVPTQIVQINGVYYARINSLTNSTYTVIWHPVKFADVAAHWAKDAINDMGSRMVVFGDKNGNYNPGRNMTRAEFAATVVRSLGLPPGTGTSSFGDVSSSAWYCGYVETAVSYGIIEGYSAATFGPNDPVTREQAMAMIERTMKITGLDAGLTDSETGKLLGAYSDGASASAYAKDSIAACLKTGVVSGTSGSMIAPRHYVTRAEVAVMVERLLQKSKLI